MMKDSPKTTQNLSPPVVTLPSKQSMPQIGLGTYKLIEYEALVQLLRKGIQIGIRHVDTARLYNNQVAVGKAINKVIKQGRVTREQLFIGTKTFPHKDSDPIQQIRESLRLMDLKYVDIFYVHWPIAEMKKDDIQWSHTSLQHFWKGMQECVRKGYTKHIAVSNFNGQLLGDLLTFCEIKPVANQIETHPYLPQQALVDYCLKNGIAVIAQTPLVRGNSCLKENINILKQQVICDIAARQNRTPAQIVLKWNLQRGVGVIPKTSNVFRIQENFESWTAEITEQEMKKINNLKTSVRICDGKYFMKHFSIFD